MNDQQAYLSMFRYLSNFYFQSKGVTENVDDLGALLGSMNPGLFMDGQPADSALFEDWLEILEGKRQSLTAIEAYQYMIHFLMLEQEKFRIDLAFVLTILNSVNRGSSTDDHWLHWVKECAEVVQNVENENL